MQRAKSGTHKGKEGRESDGDLEMHPPLDHNNTRGTPTRPPDGKTGRQTDRHTYRGAGHRRGTFLSWLRAYSYWVPQTGLSLVA